jgi:Na+-driven multidrug efflux pump
MIGFLVLGAAYGALGAAVAMLVTEVVVLVLMLLAIHSAGHGGFWRKQLKAPEPELPQPRPDDPYL